MATNGQSAKKWLEENQGKASDERVQQIRNSIAEKLTKLDDSDDSSSGLLEALDVLDNYLQGPEETESATAEQDVKLDLSPLGSESNPDIPQLSPEEKQAQFRKLLKSGQL
ncbi:hypothetical protein EOPP23_17250 [Endozoicomonas sp. OPT23]|uniref:hypothetical protein n=1 Tax=Endozoicomonas sp. OPT23 TaxID=2072845 RepID=UPI00129B03B6|nr:hypothetical protein [Endozoicomonas sp. OPT23]MRI34732.1 hypothetical protein [Endozoicomonas sp. OPT23]